MFLDSPRFPDDIAYGSSGGPGYSTDVIVTHSGFEQRNINWSVSRAVYDVSHGIKTPAQLAVLIAFFRVMKGRAHSFRFKDWSDFQVEAGQGIAVPVGLTGDAQLVKRYTIGNQIEDRPISKPVMDTLTILINGVESNPSITEKGIIEGVDAATIAWSGEFDVPCRFDTDSMKVGLEDYNMYTWGQIPVVEVRI